MIKEGNQGGELNKQAGTIKRRPVECKDLELC